MLRQPNRDRGSPKERTRLAELALSQASILPVRWPLSIPGASGFVLETILPALAQWPERGRMTSSHRQA